MPQTRSGPLPYIVFVLFLLWVFSPGEGTPSQSLILSDVVTQRIGRYHDALDVLNQSRWGDFAPKKQEDHEDSAEALGIQHGYINLTGFRGEDQDGFGWEDFAYFRQRGLELSRYAVPGDKLWEEGRGEPMWTNVSGVVQGDWVRKPGSVAKTYDHYNLTRIVPGLDWVGDQTDWARNITGISGDMLLRVEGNKTIETYKQDDTGAVPVGGGLVRNIRGTATIMDVKGSGHTWDMRLWGAHWPRLGVVMMTTTSEKFEGIFGLPHLMPSVDLFRSSQKLLNASIGEVIAHKEDNALNDQNMPWNSDMENPLFSAYPSPHCELIIYAQVHPPLSNGDALDPAGPGRSEAEKVIQAIESELEHPLGAPISKIPPLKMSALIYSPDCGFFLESKGPPDFPPGQSQHLVGSKDEVHLHHIKSWLLMFAATIAGLVWLLQDQIKESATPSTMGRISFWTISDMVLFDGILFLGSATWVSSAAGTFLPSMALMFTSGMSTMIGFSFLGKVFEVQLPESRRRDPTPATTNDNSGVPSTSDTPPAPSVARAPPPSTGGSLLPAPVTAARPQESLPVIVSSDQDNMIGDDNTNANTGAAATTATGEPPVRTPRQRFNEISVRYTFAGLCIGALTISSSSWYPGIRSIYLNTCAFAYLSMWIPQIYRNTMRNCRRALKWKFVIGQSVLRLSPLAYFWVYEGNFVFAKTEPRAFLGLCGWLWLQIFLLLAQDVVGPRFGLPASWTPEAWDYHPILKEDGIEAGGLPIGLVADDQPGLDRPKGADDDEDKRQSSLRKIDCAICMVVLEVPVVKSGDEASSVANAFSRRTYMVTPCRHIFHTKCLEGWLKYRLQCPICREDLPPL